MFFQKKKGTYQYLKKAPVYQGIITLVLLILPVGLFFIGYSITGNFKNLFTVFAVLGMLPAAKYIVSFIMYLRAEKFSCKEGLYSVLKDYEGKGALIGYDYYMTSYSVNYPLYAAAAGKNCLVGLLANPKSIAKDCEEHIKEYLKKNEINDLTVKVFEASAEDKFLDRVKALSESEDPITDTERRGFALLSSLSL